MSAEAGLYGGERTVINVDELQELRRCNRDLLALTSLSVLLSGRDLQGVAAMLADVVASTFRLELVYVCIEGAEEGGHRAMRVGGKNIPGASSERIARTLEEKLGREPDWYGQEAIDGLVEGAPLYLSCTPIGLGHDLGKIVTGSPQRGFPNENDRLLLSVAANLTTAAIENVRLFRLAQEEIAERKRAEEALQLNAQVLESMTEGVSVSDEQGYIIYTNPAEDRIFGYDPGELIGKHVTVQNDYPPAENERMVASVMEHLRTEGTWTGEWRNRRKDGTPFTTFSRITTLDTGEKLCFVCVQEDVTERRRTEEARARLAAIVDSSEDAIVSKDLNGIVTSWNRAAERIYGWKAEDIIGRSKALVIPPDMPEELPSILRQVRAGDHIRHYETRRIRKDGTVFHAAISVSPVVDASGKIVEAATIVRDITAEVQTRREIEALNDRLRRAMQEIHHRVKNNLQVIAGMVDIQLLDRQGEASLPVEEFVRLGSYVRTLAAAHDVLTHDFREEHDKQMLSVRSIFDRIAPLIGETAKGRPVCFGEGDVILPSKRATALALVANELISNAVKHGHGTIRVSLVPQNGSAVLTVRDEGPGFPSNFDPAVAANTGLMLLESLVRIDLSGKIHFGNAVDGGGEVSVTVPIWGTESADTHQRVN